MPIVGPIGVSVVQLKLGIAKKEGKGSKSKYLPEIRKGKGGMERNEVPRVGDDDRKNG